MICRRIEKCKGDQTGKNTLVFFGVVGTEKGSDGTLNSIFTDDKKSYADGIDGVNQSVKQRLSLIKGELYHFMNAGFPLTDKISSKQIIDARIISVLSHHSEVTSIDKIESKVVNRSYFCKVYFSTRYGSTYIEINRTV